MGNKKKILFVCQYFYPEIFRGNDVAFHWAEEGHDVHVVTGIPNYPDGVFHKGYGMFKNRNQVVNGVRVTRLPIFPRGNNKIMLIPKLKFIDGRSSESVGDSAEFSPLVSGF